MTVALLNTKGWRISD